MNYPTPEEYNKWIEKVRESENPDLCVLETFFDTVVQYMNDPKSLVTELTLKTAMGCVDNYLENYYLEDKS